MKSEQTYQPLDLNGSYCYILQQYIEFAPKRIAIKFCNGYDRKDERWHSKDNDWCTFAGLKFESDKVYAIGVYIWKAYDEYLPRYLEVTRQFEELLKTYNHYHAAIILSKALISQKKESFATQDNIILHIKYDREELLPKFRDVIYRHNGRGGRFSESYFEEHRTNWDKVLHQAISKVCNRLAIDCEQRTERPSSLLFRYSIGTELHIHKANVQPSDEIPPQGKRNRRPRTLFGTFNIKRK